MVWTYKGVKWNPPDNFSQDVYYGFVYCITNRATGQKYIGKKFFWSKKTLPITKKRKRRKITYVESDWQDYYGSSETVKLLVEQNGKENFHREILRLCRKKAEMSYYEAKRQFELDCLLYPEQYYNEFIGCKINRWHLLTKKKN